MKLNTLFPFYSTLLDHVDVNGMGISPVDIHDEMQNTPLHVAVKFSEEKNVQLLLQHGADPNAVGKNESTPLHKARSPRMAEILLSYGADPYKLKYSKNELLKTAYDVFLNKNASAANMLLDNGITSNGRDLTSTNLMIIFDFKPFRRQTSFSNGEMSLHHKIQGFSTQVAIYRPLLFLLYMEQSSNPLAW